MALNGLLLFKYKEKCENSSVDSFDTVNKPKPQASLFTISWAPFRPWLSRVYFQLVTNHTLVSLLQSSLLFNQETGQGQDSFPPISISL